MYELCLALLCKYNYSNYLNFLVNLKQKHLAEHLVNQALIRH